MATTASTTPPRNEPRPPAAMTVLATIGLGGFGVLLLVLFLRAIPGAAALAKAGESRHRLLPCDQMRPALVSGKLGRFPTPAPSFTLPDYQGAPLQLESLRGQVVLLNFWATWCPPCVAEMASLEALVGSMNQQRLPVRTIAVSVDEDWNTVRQFFAKGTPLQVLLDKERKVPELYGTSKFPETFVIDKRGQVRYLVISDRDWSRPEFAACLTRLAQEEE